MKAKLFAYLSYREARPALAFLREGLGFEVVHEQWRDDTILDHAELRLGDVVIMAASADAPYRMPPLIGRSTGYGLYLLVDNADERYERAMKAGGRSVYAPESTPWGTRRARILDPEGYEWSFGTYEPGMTW